MYPQNRSVSRKRLTNKSKIRQIRELLNSKSPSMEAIDTEKHRKSPIRQNLRVNGQQMNQTSVMQQRGALHKRNNSSIVSTQATESLLFRSVERDRVANSRYQNVMQSKDRLRLSRILSQEEVDDGNILFTPSSSRNSEDTNIRFQSIFEKNLLDYQQRTLSPNPNVQLKHYRLQQRKMTPTPFSIGIMNRRPGMQKQGSEGSVLNRTTGKISQRELSMGARSKSPQLKVKHRRNSSGKLIGNSRQNKVSGEQRTRILNNRKLGGISKPRMLTRKRGPII